MGRRQRLEQGIVFQPVALAVAEIHELLRLRAGLDPVGAVEQLWIQRAVGARPVGRTIRADRPQRQYLPPAETGAGQPVDELSRAAAQRATLARQCRGVQQRAGSTLHSLARRMTPPVSGVPPPLEIDSCRAAGTGSFSSS